MANAELTDEAQRLLQLSQFLDQDTGFSRIVAALKEGEPATLDGVWGSSCALVAAALAGQNSSSALLYVCADADDIEDVADELALFHAQEALLFPAIEGGSGESALLDESYGQRLRTLKQITRLAPQQLIVTSIQALIQPVPPHAALADQTRYLRVGETADLDELSSWLATHRYHHTTAVELPGEFSIRGGIIDIFATDWLDPVRVEMFGDEVESMRRFDVKTQRSLMTLVEVEITVLQSSSRSDAHLAEYLPADTWVMLVEPDRIHAEGRQFLQRLDDPQQHHPVAEVLRQLSRFPLLTASGLASNVEPVVAHLNIEAVDRFGGDVSQVRQQLQGLDAKHEAFVVAQTEAESRRLREILATTPLLAAGQMHFPIGRLQSGFHLVEQAVYVLSGAQLFGRMDVRRVPRRRTGKAIDSFLDLREGDLVVHLAHGIGRYRGLQVLTKDDHVEEHLEIEFHGGTRIFVPSSRIELVQKYVGGRKAHPRLARVGGKQWLRQKEAAQQAVTDLAVDMLELHAGRESQPGIALGDDTDWQQEFDASFPYHETPDQLDAMDAIKQDLASPRPMDRLLCGDVGFGKTEMAMRAAFKAIDNGYQVAVLVPTTILAEQHFRTFHERMAEFPFEIAKLSRFSTAKQQREVIQRLAAGSVDVVIGTHRLASKDVTFHNLGLLIIDEEQRFGVEIKDRLKALRTSVNVLTLSATPIPRTLHMALTGMRGISNLETPPEDRLAVETRVTRWSDQIIHHAVMRELSRNGQIYFVHNRVHDIQALAQRLSFIVPEARLGIGHGQMPEHDLEQVMLDFVAHRFDLLLATTIIESGLDIPNANTIFIDDADQYGLADLHQLRGRVGRYKHRAYCYLLVDPARSLTPNSSRRLRAIEEFSDMGAGFAIAMRDLEIRGAGNILGTQQSGHIATVGYELYCQLLEAAIRRLKHLPPKLEADVTIDLPGEAYLPRDYVPDMRAKIDLYRRLARIWEEDALATLQDELLDRFGPLPEAAQRLLELARLKNDAAVWQLVTIRIEAPYLVFGYADRQRAEQLVRASGGRLRIVDGESMYYTLAPEAALPDQIIQSARSLLRS